MEPIVVSPPLRGDWNALNCPGDQVPSHGDLLQPDWTLH